MRHLSKKLTDYNCCRPYTFQSRPLAKNQISFVQSCPHTRRYKSYFKPQIHCALSSSCSSSATLQTQTYRRLTQSRSNIIVRRPYKASEMKPAFLKPATLSSRTQVHGTAICPSTPTTTRCARATVQMVAEKKKDESILDWLYGKLMHNALWDGDEEIGYEPYWKEIEAAREEKKKTIYEDMEEKEK